MYVLAQSPVAVNVVWFAGSFQETVYGPFPPVTVAVASPIHVPLHSKSITLENVTTIGVGWVMFPETLKVQLFASVTVTV